MNFSGLITGKSEKRVSIAGHVKKKGNPFGDKDFPGVLQMETIKNYFTSPVAAP